MADGRRIDVHDATIRTATVEVKTLTISGKQVTLAVFRQLQEENLIDGDTATFRGLPWGTVNYHPDKACVEMKDHVHVVWQQGQELRRATVMQRPWVSEEHVPNGYYEHKSSLEDSLLPDWFAVGLAEHSLKPEYVKAFRPSRFEGHWSVKHYRYVNGCHLDVDTFWLDGDFKASVESLAALYEQDGEFVEELRGKVRGGIIAAFKQSLGKEVTMAEIAADLDRMIAKQCEGLRQFIASWEARWTEITALDQLFIAV